MRSIFLFCFLSLAGLMKAQKTPDLSKMKHYPGFVEFYWDDSNGKVYLHIKNLDQEFLYNTGLAAGVGSNDIGLDRGQLGNEHVVVFSRTGEKIFLTEKNYDYRAYTENLYEKRAVEEAFAQSILWGFKVVDRTREGYLVDATEFLLRDAHKVKERLSNTNQGNYRVEPSRCGIYLPRTKNFPKNSEFEAIITLIGEAKGRHIRSVTPSPDAISVRQHHSFIQLPDDQYLPRRFDPRSGFFSIAYHDYATPIDQPIRKRYIVRHRLEKKDPEATVSEPVEPIVYHLDAGVPEPIRSALLEGAAWWNQAFEAAGFKNAFQVKMMPPDADPLDVRYNLIQWVHRSTRGWSYGSSVIDPRTGEIIKGHVSLGSLRVRQDYLIAQGMAAMFKGNSENSGPLVELALARLRQLSAHEVGHTLGLVHNYTASTNNRSSVMDYPHPLISVDEHGTDFSQAYDDKIGAWDKRAILYGYQDFPKNVNENNALNQILEENNRLGLRFLSDQDARPAGSAHPYAHLWDNGKTVVDELNRIIDIRSKALDRFGLDNIPTGTPVAELEEVLVPLYMSHRYQTEAVAKLIGGVEYRYAVKGEPDVQLKIVDYQMQKEALEGLTKVLDPEFLTLPDRIISLILPRPMGYQRNRELFKTRTGITFDPLAAAEASAALTLHFILHPNRMSRLVEFAARETDQMSVMDVLQYLNGNINEFVKREGLKSRVGEVVRNLFLDQLIRLASDQTSHHQVQGAAIAMLEQISGDGSVGSKAHDRLMKMKIQRYFSNPDAYEVAPDIALPAGSPIGCNHN